MAPDSMNTTPLDSWGSDPSGGRHGPPPSIRTLEEGLLLAPQTFAGLTLQFPLESRERASRVFPHPKDPHLGEKAPQPP